MNWKMLRRIIVAVLISISFCGALPSTQAAAADRSSVEQFATRFYVLCLNRAPDQAGLDSWVTALLNGTQTGSDVVFGFVFSQEFFNKNTSNKKFLSILYEAFFNREADPAE